MARRFGSTHIHTNKFPVVIQGGPQMSIDNVAI